MADTDPRPRRRLRRRWVLLGVVVAVLAGAGVAWWWVSRPPRPVSVGDVLNKYRQATPSATPTLPASTPPLGVYVYATSGSERISAGVTHRYPRRTTVTVTASGCGLQVRWDALSGRWAAAQLCTTPSGWRVSTYTDVHTFLYMKDVHDYRCNEPVPTADGWSVRCPTSGGELTSTVHRLGPAPQRVAGRTVTTARVRVEQSATGKSLSSGTIDAWVLPNGLPARLDITDHGSQVVLGSRVTYDEHASFTLTSTSPQR